MHVYTYVRVYIYIHTSSLANIGVPLHLTEEMAKSNICEVFK